MVRGVTVNHLSFDRRSSILFGGTMSRESGGYDTSLSRMREGFNSPTGRNVELKLLRRLLGRADRKTLIALAVPSQGDLTQRPECLICNERVMGSTPIVSTESSWYTYITKVLSNKYMPYLQLAFSLFTS